MGKAARRETSTVVTSLIVLGLGRVGSRNAERRELETLSHVGAALAAGGIEIGGLVDPDPASREAAAALWAGRTNAPIMADHAGLKADIVVVGGPTATRKAQIAAALACQPKILLVEKPLAPTAAEAREIVETCRKAGVLIRVNYNRRFDPGHVLFRRQLDGPPIKALTRYGKGLLNYSSHMIDLLLHWFGDIVEVQALGARPEGDGALDYRCRSEAGFDAVLIGFDGLGYDQFEMEFYYSDRRLALHDAGTVKLRASAVPDRVYPGYAHLADPGEVLHRGVVGGFVETYTALRNYLQDGTEPGGCTAAEAIRNLDVIEAALKSAACQGRPVAL